jgi:phosphoacetylglucosamine mutase
MSTSQSLAKFLKRYPKQTKSVLYGTAGFRDNINLPLDPIFARMGILACIRSLSNGGKAVGIMVTASHNPECDNGVKMIDSTGGMLHTTWESYAEKMANAQESDMVDTLQSILDAAGITDNDIAKASPPIVVIGRDTRPHSLALAHCIEEGINAFGGITVDVGEVTTPQLHFIVGTCNTKNIPLTATSNTAELVALYHTHFSTAFSTLIHTKADGSSRGNTVAPTQHLIIDASNGVGSLSVADTVNSIQGINKSEPLLQIDLRNPTGSGPVNLDCGAEHVQKNVRPPANTHATTDKGKLMCSFDGDADRIVFHAFRDTDWILMDGDKISALFMTFLQKELSDATSLLPALTLKLGVVQTAYANGSSTKYFRDKGIAVAMAKTGVKHLHHKAHELYDIGVYFEANGHGTILFSDSFVEQVRAATSALTAETRVLKAGIAVQRLNATVDLVNQFIGDSISDMLLSLASLQLMDMSVDQWHELYSDLPSKMIKMAVRDKNAILCSEDESEVISPAGLQNELQTAMTACTRGRCFVRPSGTEDVVRIYAEAATMAEVEQLLIVSQDIVKKYA